MQDNQSSELNILSRLQEAIGSECPNCGEVNPADAKKCEGCGNVFPSEEEDPSFSYVHGEGLKGGEPVKTLEKIPLSKAKNLILLADTLDALENGEITLENYTKNVNKVLNEVSNAASILKTDFFVKKIENMPPAQKNIAVQTEYLFTQYESALKRMLEYKGGPDLTPAVEGYDMVEETLEKIDKLQDKVIDESQYEQEEVKEETPVENKQLI